MILYLEVDWQNENVQGDILKNTGQIIRKRLPVFMGNEKMYMKFLGMLFQDPSMEKLGQALKDRITGRHFTAAHTLKGGYREYGANASI